MAREKPHNLLGEKEVILGVNVMPDEEGSIEIMDQVFLNWLEP